MTWLDCVDRDVPPTIPGDGTATMDLVHVEDVARANILALSSAQAEDVYNVGSGVETPLLELWRTLQRITGAHHLEPGFRSAKESGAVLRHRADTTRARRELGFAAEISLEEGLRRLACWRREQRGVEEVA